MPTRQDTFLVELWVEDDPGGSTNGSSPPGNYFDVWDKKTGGDVDSDEVVYYPGGMVGRIALGGRVTYTNITLQRIYDGIVDHQAAQVMLDGVGKAVVEVNQRPMDINGHAYGTTLTWVGKLKRVRIPDVDSEGTAAALFEVEITVNQEPQMS